MVVSAKVITGRDGLRRTELVHRTAADKLDASTRLFPLDQLREELIDAVLAAPVVPNRADQAKQVGPIVDALLQGLGSDAEKLLSSYGDRIASRIVSLVTEEHRRTLGAPKYEEVIEIIELGEARTLTRTVSEDRFGKFSKSVAYGGWKRSLYGVDWFDSSPERSLANIVDDHDDVEVWVRLLTGQLPILFTVEGRNYNADFIVVECDISWIIEVKADRDVNTAEVQAKRTAARRWMNYVNAADETTDTWKYLLVSETDLNDAKGSWNALKTLGS
jgi:type III restriction enzyme